MPKPTDILLDHLADLLAVFAGGTPPSQAWLRMPGTVTTAMSQNTFKTIAPTIVATTERLEAVEQQLSTGIEQELMQLRGQLRTVEQEKLAIVEQKCHQLREMLHNVEQERDSLRQALQTVEQQPLKTVEYPAPDHFEGWLVQKDKRGYLRLVRRVKGKVLALHVGRSWDEDKAREKIAQLPTH